MRLFVAGILLGCPVLIVAPAAAAEDPPASRASLWNREDPARKPVIGFAQGSLSTLPLGPSGDFAWSARWNGPNAAALWTELALELIVKYQQNPLRAARVLALLHTAMHDALVLAAERKLDPAERLAAMHRAAGLVLNHLYPQESAGRLEGLGVAAVIAVAARAGARTDLMKRALQAGEEAAGGAITRSMRDGAGRQWHVRLRPADAPGRWRATPPLNAYDPTEALAGTWRTWVLRDGAEFPPRPPLAVESAAYSKEVEEVLQVARSLTAEQKAIADRWNLGQATVTPAGVWNMITLDLVRAGGLDAERSVEVLAALNVAMMDAFIACWHVKFAWWTERPVTAIRERLDPAFLPHLVTPAFPSYTSGHSTVSGAAEVVLATYFPERAAWLREQSEEAAMSRLYGGIHFRSDNDEGLKHGRRIGERVVEYLRDRRASQRAGATTR